MKRFLTQCIIFSVFVIATIAVGEYYVRTQILNPYRYKNEYIEKNGKQVEMLILGSSYNYYGISPKELGFNSFNLANVGQEWFYDRLLLEHYIPLMPNLKYVLLNVSTFSLFVDKDAVQSDEFAPNYKMYMGIDYYPDFSTRNFEFFNFSVYSDKLRSILIGKNVATYDSLGLGNKLILHPREPYFERYYAATIERHTTNDTTWLDTNKGYLLSIIKTCREHGIKLLLVTTPTWQTYYDNMPGWQIDMMLNTIKGITDEYHIPYFNHLKCEILEHDDFYDVDHLTTSGAAKFSNILHNEIDNYINSTKQDAQ